MKRKIIATILMLLPLTSFGSESVGDLVLRQFLDYTWLVNETFKVTLEKQ